MHGRQINNGMPQPGIIHVNQHNFPVLEHEVSGVKILMNKRVSIRNAIDQFHDPCRLLGLIKAGLPSRDHFLAKPFLGIRKRSLFKLGMMDFQKRVRDQIGIFINFIRMLADFLTKRLCIDHFINHAIVLPNLYHVKRDHGWNSVYEGSFCRLPAAIDSLGTMTITEIHFYDGLIIQTINRSVSAFSKHLAALNGNLTHRFFFWCLTFHLFLLFAHASASIRTFFLRNLSKNVTL